MGERANGRMGEWANGRMGEWANGRMGETANGRMGEWANGRVGEWACGRMGVWANGRVGVSEGRWGESGRSGLSRHSGLRGRFVGWRLPVHCLRFAPFALSPIRFPPLL